MRVGKLTVASPPEPARNSDLQISVNTKRMLLHSHSLVAEYVSMAAALPHEPDIHTHTWRLAKQTGAGRGGSGARGWHAECTNFMCELTFESVKLVQVFASDLRGCTHLKDGTLWGRRWTDLNGATDLNDATVSSTAFASTSTKTPPPKPLQGWAGLAGPYRAGQYREGEAGEGEADGSNAPSYSNGSDGRSYANGPSYSPSGGTAGGGIDECGRVMSVANGWVRYRKLVVKASAELLPTCRRVLKRLAQLFQDQDLFSVVASSSAQDKQHVLALPSFRPFGAALSGLNLDDEEFVGSEPLGSAPHAHARTRTHAHTHTHKAALSHEQQFASMSQVVVGTVDVRGVELHVALYGGEMLDSAECALFVLQELEWRVQIERPERDLDVYRFLELNLGVCLLMKLRRGPLPNFQDPLVTADTIKRRVVRLQGAESILLIPHCKLDLSSVQTGTAMGALSQLIACELDSNFNVPIQVSVDAYLYHWLTTLVLRFASASSSSFEDDDFEPFSPAARTMSGTSEQVGHGRATGGPTATDAPHLSSPPSSVNSNKIRGGGVAVRAGSREVKTRKHDYRCIYFKLEPQIAVMQEVTPDIITILGWFNITKRETICGTLHEVFINSIEKVLHAVVAANVSRTLSDNDTEDVAAGALDGQRLLGAL
jgi:hypothetical protein